MSFSPAEQATNQYDETGAEDDRTHSDHGCLLRTSPSVLRMTHLIGMLGTSFPAQLLTAMKKIVENPAVGIQYHVSHDAYTPIHQLQQLSRQMLYQFSLTTSSRGDLAFIRFDPRQSALLTAICFGGSIADELSLPAPGSADRPTFSRIGKQLLDQFAQALATAWRTLCSPHLATDKTEQTASETAMFGQIQWLGAASSPPEPFTDDCLPTRFDLNFHDPADATVQTTIPICFYTPINAFTQALVQADAPRGADSESTKGRIVRFLGQITITTCVDLAPVTLSLGRLRTLRAGDILPISDPNKAVMHVAGKNLFMGTTGQQAGNLTLQIDNYGGQVSE